MHKKHYSAWPMITSLPLYALLLIYPYDSYIKTLTK
jgi:hypothetical protein